MTILGIETSCDETAAAVLTKTGDRIQILSNIVASSASLQAKYGGVIPEQAARKQLLSILPVINEALNESSLQPANLDAIAVTQGPGLIGSLLVGVETAKTLALAWNKPLIPVNHLLGHFYANWIDTKQVSKFPCIGLLVSGGHTDLVLFKNDDDYKYLGGTRDDAAGECFDKCARLLGYPYPGGPKISKIASKGNPKNFQLPKPMVNSKNFEFSFSGLKTAFSNLVAENFNITSIDPKNAESNWKRIVINNSNLNKNEQILADLCACLEQTIIDVLIKKLILAVQKYKVEQIIVAGGVASNTKLKNDLELLVTSNQLSVTIHIPPPHLCTDNAAMIASRAFFKQALKNPLNLQASPNLSLALKPLTNQAINPRI